MLITMRRRQKKESDYDYQTISMVTYWMNRKLQQKKIGRPLSFTDVSPQKTKVHSAVELLNTLSTAIEKVAAQNAEAKST